MLRLEDASINHVNYRHRTWTLQTRRKKKHFPQLRNDSRPFEPRPRSRRPLGWMTGTSSRACSLYKRRRRPSLTSAAHRRYLNMKSVVSTLSRVINSENSSRPLQRPLRKPHRYREPNESESIGPRLCAECLSRKLRRSLASISSEDR